jgi:2-methylcitrate dehydratase PrpD
MSGPHNFITGHAPTGNPRLLVERLGDLYQVTRANIKRWTVGFPIHAPLDAVEEMLKKQTIDPQRIREVIVRYPPASITDNSAAVDINVQHALSVMLVDRKLTFKSIHDIARMKDPVVLTLKQKIRLDPGPANATAANRPPLVQIVMTDGARLTQDNVGPAVLGTAGNPLSREQLLAKCRELMSPVLGAQQTSRLIDRVMALDTVKDVRELRPLLQASRRSGPPRLSEYPGAG